MLLGEYFHNIDAKGRIILPSKFRTELGDRFIVTKGFDGCLYGYSVEDNYQQKIEDQISTLSIFSKLIENEVRIINVSYGYKDEMVLAATNNIRNARTVISDEAEALTIGLAKLIKQGYDFLIVVAAGNGYAKDYVENFSDTNNAPYGYEVYNSKERRHNGLTHITGYNDPMYSFHLTYIGSDSDEEGEDDLVKQRIMVVGAVKHISLHNYMEARFSNEGNRVDVYAPGVQILSTIPQNIIGDEYRTMNGTSMATPHISGLAALMLQANPTLRSEQIKNIIIECAGESVNTYDYSVNPNSPTLKGTVYMPNAESCVIRALDIAGGHSYYDEFFPSGTIKGKVVSDSGKSLDAIQVTLVRTSIGDANLKDYYFTTLTDEQGEFSVEVPQGKYDMIINGSTISEGTILPYKTSDIEVEPDRIVYLQTIVVSFLNTSQEIMGKCDVVGCVYDAITGATIDGAIIKARTGWNNYNGAYVNQRLWGGNNTLSDSYGNFALELYRGQYTIEVVKEGYIMGYFNVSAVKQNDRTRQTIVLTPVLDDDEYRIILVWGSEPRDLDAHLTFYKNGTKKMHMYFSNKVGYVDDKEIAILDIDDTRSYGPETITIKKKPENDEVF